MVGAERREIPRCLSKIGSGCIDLIIKKINQKYFFYFQKTFEPYVPKFQKFDHLEIILSSSPIKTKVYL